MDSLIPLVAEKSNFITLLQLSIPTAEFDFMTGKPRPGFWRVICQETMKTAVVYQTKMEPISFITAQ